MKAYLVLKGSSNVGFAGFFNAYLGSVERICDIRDDRDIDRFIEDYNVSCITIIRKQVMLFNDYNGMKGPCKDCSHRQVGCHSECDEYIMFRCKLALVKGSYVPKVQALVDSSCIRDYSVEKARKQRNLRQFITGLLW